MHFGYCKVCGNKSGKTHQVSDLPQRVLKGKTHQVSDLPRRILRGKTHKVSDLPRRVSALKGKTGVFHSVTSLVFN